MNDGVEVILALLALVLGGAAFIIGGHVVREAWRGVSKDPSAATAPASPAWGRPEAGAMRAPPEALPRGGAEDSRP